ncbi:DUF2812 domain-containing protein [Bacillus cytotoxicus]|uniref:DUF2812 domain-containing protein n=2 Tax=Bacillus cytotoxicus TaxID=580165 RepID=A0AAX2CHB9_9BACI|nr:MULTISPECIES: DUF2812 domain-containing protein [Bacillus cereus group]ABS22306.1 conserved hypothetical protein [Bacillus cytotoxicus NVH 391-98]AWC28915.1 DUF2812 domain-containing protein [Bacillus cytotoxicus]AWC32909.1 DUF2812 domain-containing protein [Bacillus cytotoxicus]AWC36933.1 DUF2812 domain-containing protein [Bacillus cytotoxicus]AWC39699.1 DUF2812 domain-containing protein [Bacillus cytotoxicus]
MEIKKTFKFFTAWNLEKEEAYLREMHQKGWAFQKYHFMYTFKKTEPKDVVYKADFNFDFQKSLKNQREYLEIYEMSGWKYVSSFTKWHYFCKEVVDKNELPDIYSETETRIEKLKDLLNHLVIIFLSILPAISISCLESPANKLSIIIKGFIGFVVCIHMYMFVRLILKIRKLKKEII